MDAINQGYVQDIMNGIRAISAGVPLNENEQVLLLDAYELLERIKGAA